MSRIEHSDAYKMDLIPLIDTSVFGINLYEDLVDRAYNAKLISFQDGTIVDLLWQTFDYTSNHCTAEYLKIVNNSHE